MKLIRTEFESEQDRDLAALEIIAIREKTPEPVLLKHTPSLMIWDSEIEEFGKALQRRGVSYRIDKGIEISA